MFSQKSLHHNKLHFETLCQISNWTTTTTGVVHTLFFSFVSNRLNCSNVTLTDVGDIFSMVSTVFMAHSSPAKRQRSVCCWSLDKTFLLFFHSIPIFFKGSTLKSILNQFQLLQQWKLLLSTNKNMFLRLPKQISRLEWYRNVQLCFEFHKQKLVCKQNTFKRPHCHFVTF